MSRRVEWDRDDKLSLVTYQVIRDRSIFTLNERTSLAKI